MLKKMGGTAGQSVRGRESSLGWERESVRDGGEEERRREEDEERARTRRAGGGMVPIAIGHPVRAIEARTSQRKVAQKR